MVRNGIFWYTTHIVLDTLETLHVCHLVNCCVACQWRTGRMGRVPSLHESAMRCNSFSRN